jgi:fructokinase
MMAPEIVAAAARGDREAVAALERYESRMARGLAAVINVLDPDVIVLGGGMSNIERLYENVPKLWAPHVFACGAGQIGMVRGSATRSVLRSRETVRTGLLRARHGDSSGVRGAAWLWDPLPGSRA